MSLPPATTGYYMKVPYDGVKVHVDPAAFQRFVENYRRAFTQDYKSPMAKQDTFRITYEQLCDTERFSTEILPKLWRFLDVADDVPFMPLPGIDRQSSAEYNLADTIDNYAELEFAFRHTDVLHLRQNVPPPPSLGVNVIAGSAASASPVDGNGTWSILLPICSRASTGKDAAAEEPRGKELNRFSDLEARSFYDCQTQLEDEKSMLGAPGSAGGQHGIDNDNQCHKIDRIHRWYR